MKKEFILPKTLEELWEARAVHPRGALLAGGTDLLVRIRAGRADSQALISLDRIPDLRGISTGDGEIFIGPATTHQQLLDDYSVQKHLPLLRQSVEVLGSPQVRHMGTLGGNICTASPAGDTLPALYVLGARLDLRSPQGCRTVPIKEFIEGPGKTVLRKDEILSGIRVPMPDPGFRAGYHKVGQRKAMAIAVVSMACQVWINDHGTVGRIRLGWGSVGPTVKTLPEVEKFLEGRPLSLEVLREAGQMVSKGVTPIDDVRAGAAYRRLVAGRILLRLLDLLRKEVF
ncbi:MAG: hypothetical protein JL50_18255 [Peptococcaceae bacterium BICA1-7]|nr:MAG: hypothetical protein JL50_18255 [Peptococcaceae bacterium BICA1-7]HBV96351.1 xanthine dehydrogenase family protein subunit M [Desulfotomaculum sp.]